MVTLANNNASAKQNARLVKRGTIKGKCGNKIILYVYISVTTIPKV